MALSSDNATPESLVSGVLMGMPMSWPWWSLRTDGEPMTTVLQRQRRCRSFAAMATVAVAILLAVSDPWNYQKRRRIPLTTGPQEELSIPKTLGASQPPAREFLLGSPNSRPQATPSISSPKSASTQRPQETERGEVWVASLGFLASFLALGFVTLGLFRLMVVSFHQFLLSLIEMDLRRREELQERRIQDAQLQELHRRSQIWLLNDSDDDDDVSLEPYVTTTSPLFSYEEEMDDDSSWWILRGSRYGMDARHHHRRRRQDRRAVNTESCNAQLERHRRRFIYQLLDGYWTTLVKQDFHKCRNDDGEEEWHLHLPPPGQRLVSTSCTKKRSLSLATCQCAVCLCGAYEVGDCIVWSSNPNCCHVYHLECVVQWFLRKMEHANNDAKWEETLSCPYCRLCFFSSDKFTRGASKPAKQLGEPVLLAGGEQTQTRWWNLIGGGGGGRISTNIGWVAS